MQSKFFFLARNRWNATIKNSLWGTERPENEKKQARCSQKKIPSLPSTTLRFASVNAPENGTRAFIQSSPILNKNAKCIHQYSHIFCLHWQLFNSYPSQCKWAHSFPLPIEVKWYEQLNINDWEWLIDPPTRRPPQTDRNSDRRMHPSPCFLTFHSVSLPSVAPFGHRFRHTWTLSFPTTYKPLKNSFKWEFNSKIHVSHPAYAEQASKTSSHVQTLLTLMYY